MSREFRAPGRVNLIGEHTDYNLGFVLPIALDMACVVTRTEGSDGHISLHALDRDETADFAVSEIALLKPMHRWTDYPVGVAQQLLSSGFRIDAAKLEIHSTVPEGSGLSSSAALEVSSALALLGDQRIDPLELAKLCQRAEIEFVGMPCGIMDQYISVFGKANAAVRIDCLSLEYQLVELPENAAIIAVNSMVKHELASSAYRDRVEECAMAVDAIQRQYPEVKSLRDATMEHLEKVKLPNLILRRARHIVTENARVLLFVKAAARRDLARMGELFVESHVSMQHDYEISCPEIDFLVDAAVGIPGVYGARMTGGGFGGCTVNLVRPDAVKRFEESIIAAYQERFSVIPKVFACVPSEGAREI